MPSLDWIGKASVVNHHLQAPYRLVNYGGKRNIVHK